MEHPQRKKPKKVIQVAGNPKYAAIARPAVADSAVAGTVTPRPTHEVTNPKTQTVEWGCFPELKLTGRTFPAGSIRLRHGEHKGPNNGYGLAHIWEAHFKSDELSTPIQALPKIADFIAEILQQGSQIFYEWGNGRAGNKTTVFKGKKGVVILEERQDAHNNTFYSIVTAYPGQKVYGNLVGTLPAQAAPDQGIPQK
jgi:hypothetical protein